MVQPTTAVGRRRGRRLHLVLLVTVAFAGAAAPAAHAGPFSPNNTSPPTIAGDVRVGSTLTADPGTWTGVSLDHPVDPNVPFDYTWQRCGQVPAVCVTVQAGPGQTYVPTLADAGSLIRVVVTVTATGGDTATAEATTPGGVKLAIAPVPANVGLPLLTGQARANETVAGTVGYWTESPTSFARQWVRCATAAGTACEPLPGQTSASHEVTRADVGSTLRLQVIATNANGPSAPALSAPTAVVQPAVLLARLRVSPTTSCTGLPVRLDASASRGPDAIVDYEFGYSPISMGRFLYFAYDFSGGLASSLSGQALLDGIDRYTGNGYPPVPIASGPQPTAVTTFNWDGQFIEKYAAYGARQKLAGAHDGDYVRDPVELRLTVRDAAGRTASTGRSENWLLFAQNYSSQPRAGCPRSLRSFSRSYSFAALKHVATSSSGVQARVPCRSAIACAGRIQIYAATLRARSSRSRRRAPALLADSGIFRVGSHRTATIRSKLTRGGRRLLRPRRRVRARIVVTSVNALGRAVRRSFNVTLRRRR